MQRQVVTPQKNSSLVLLDNLWQTALPFWSGDQDFSSTRPPPTEQRGPEGGGTPSRATKMPLAPVDSTGRVRAERSFNTTTGMPRA